MAQPILKEDGQVRWQERVSQPGTTHPELAAYAPVLQRLGGARRERQRGPFGTGDMRAGGEMELQGGSAAFDGLSCGAAAQRTPRVVRRLALCRR